MGRPPQRLLAHLQFYPGMARGPRPWPPHDHALLPSHPRRVSIWTVSISRAFVFCVHARNSYRIALTPVVLIQPAILPSNHSEACAGEPRAHATPERYISVDARELRDTDWYWYSTGRNSYCNMFPDTTRFNEMADALRLTTSL